MQRVVVLLWLLVAWTAIVWVGRIRNLIGDDTLVNWDRAWGIVVALLFLVLAAVTATLVCRTHLQHAGRCCSVSRPHQHRLPERGVV